MKKTTTVNIAGRIFHIDEDAYQQLSAYLNQLNGYFAGSEGGDEILQDIEGRIAEIFSQGISDQRQVVTLADVQKMIGLMGNPEDYIDPSEAGPAKKFRFSATSTSKRLYRDPDNKVLGGVCGGLGAYFSIDPVIFRIILLLLMIFWGTGFLLYILLWIAMPMARTALEKLEMKGEKINITSIEKSIKEELRGLQENLKGDKSDNAFEKLISFFGELLRGLFKAIESFLKVIFRGIGAIFIFVGLVLLAVIMAILIGGNTSFVGHGLNVRSWHLLDMSNMLFTSNFESFWFFASLGVVLVIPLLLMIYGGIKVMLNLKPRLKAMEIGLAVIWIVGCATLAAIGVRTAGRFSHDSSVSTRHQINYSADKIINVRLEEEAWDQRQFPFSFDKEEGTIRTSLVDFEIRRARDEEDACLEVVKFSKGGNRSEADILANRIEYQYLVNDSVIVLYPYLNLIPNEKFRGQEISVILFLHEGQSVYLDPGLRQILDYMPVESPKFEYDDEEWGHWRYKNEWRKYLGHTYTMGKRGLICQDCTSRL